MEEMSIFTYTSTWLAPLYFETTLLSPSNQCGASILLGAEANATWEWNPSQRLVSPLPISFQDSINSLSLFNSPAELENAYPTHLCLSC